MKIVSDFTCLQNVILQSGTLSLKDIGLYSTLASLPSSWRFSLRGLAALSADGVTSIRSSILSLEKAQLLNRSCMRSPNGKITGVTYELCHSSIADSFAYTVVPNALFRDKFLSLRAKGLYCLILSLPQQQWRFSVSGLSTLCKDGKDSISVAINELETTCYLQRVKQRDELGKFSKSIYILKKPSTKNEDNKQNYPDKETFKKIKAHRLNSNLDNESVNQPMTKDPITVVPTAENKTQYNNNTYKNKKYNNINLFDKITSKSLIFDVKNFSSYVKSIRYRIEYHVLIERYAQDVSLIDALVDIGAEILTKPDQTYKIGDWLYPYPYIYEHLFNLDFERFEHLVQSVKGRLPYIKSFNIKKYLTTCLINASFQLHSMSMVAG